MGALLLGGRRKCARGEKIYKTLRLKTTHGGPALTSVGSLQSAAATMAVLMTVHYLMQLHITVEDDYLFMNKQHQLIFINQNM